MKRMILTLLMAAMSISAMAETNSEMRWNKEITEKGILCIDYDDPRGSRVDPVIMTDGAFLCPCGTDSACEHANPHLPDQMGPDREKKPHRSKWPKGTACDNPISWDKAGSYVGKTFIVVGPVVKVTKPKGVRGNPTWIDIGAAFPDTRRLTLVLWENQESNFQMVKSGLLVGKNICVLGKIDNYKGVAQIELKKPGASFW